MKWKAVVQGDKPSEETVCVLAERAGQLPHKTLSAFRRDREIVFNGLSEEEAQEIADSLRRYPDVECRILPDTDEEVQNTAIYRVLLVNYRPGYRTRLRRRLQKLTHLPQEQIVIWLSKMPFALSKGIDSEAAKSIKKSITEAGGIVRIETDSLQNSVSPYRRSNAVFRASGTRRTYAEVTEELNPEPVNSLISKEADLFEDDDSRIPPVSGLSEEYTTGLPPLNEFEDSYGRVIMHAPARFAVGLPSKSLDGRFREIPSILPDISNSSIPKSFEFSPPEMLNDDVPPLVDRERQDLLTIGPVPDIVIPYAPLSIISQDLLLPPFIGASSTGLLTDESDTLFVSDKDIGLSSVISDFGENRVLKEENDESLVSKEVLLKLFLCPPAPDNEDTISEALRDVLGVSLRESWDLLRKQPALLETCRDHRRAIRIAHELESRGVTVSITRGNLSAGINHVGPGEGIQAWLMQNG